MMETLIEILGWIGSVEVVIAYGLNSYQKIKSDSPLFYALNITGGLLLIVYSIFKGAYANTFINVVWVFIAVPAVIKTLRKSKR
ncbi:CBU_0592 family membrane protein [Ohtaekwangia koreensis]|jgi:lipid-A-disaccharide synthase-like uncharacterized protein|uniref:CBU-0592-like domain-containing protein n=1 Tax=Ohtaekwangia koreensis TaxID=688867 RepID=A0A1T5K1Y7_9BACT|nr:hypothetical protein [Ohtaekwangia koreensis]SKC57772.1 hypothetical protein SAMN05660236_1730 [Ohtaekwangia koreensis]